MKKTLCYMLTATFLLFIFGCSNTSGTEEANFITDKIYMLNTPLEKTFDFEYIKFYNDNTFQGIHASFYKNPITGENEPNYTNYYGTYSIIENALTLNISNEIFSAAIIDNGNKIYFENAEFIDWTEHINPTDSMLLEFK